MVGMQVLQEQKPVQVASVLRSISIPMRLNILCAWMHSMPILQEQKSVSLTIERQAINVFLRSDVSEQAGRCNTFFDGLCWLISGN
jgi:hypothetical protein